MEQVFKKKNVCTRVFQAVENRWYFVTSILCLISFFLGTKNNLMELTTFGGKGKNIFLYMDDNLIDPIDQKGGIYIIDKSKNCRLASISPIVLNSDGVRVLRTSFDEFSELLQVSIKSYALWDKSPILELTSGSSLSDCKFRKRLFYSARRKFK